MLTYLSVFAYPEIHYNFIDRYSVAFCISKYDTGDERSRR